MRVQLVRSLFLLILCLKIFTVNGQSDSIATVKDKTEIDFLFSYYHQEGNNSAVTGGSGTEKLSDYASAILVNIPTKPTRNLLIEYGVSYFTSASSDNIDPYTISSASSYALVNKLHFTTVYKDTARNSQTGVRYGGTLQNNFVSGTVGGFYSRESENKNSELKIQGSAAIDKWALSYPISTLYPEELRGTGEHVHTDKRYSYSLGFSFKQVLTRRLQVQAAAELIYQAGLLSAPFHRVYFTQQFFGRIEKLPTHRVRVPLTLRINYFPFDKLVMRGWYRYYSDDFGMQAHSLNLELPVKLTPFFSVYPFVNHHTQTAVDYFRGYAQHMLNEKYYTSDYDLSDLSSYEVGSGVFYSPVTGIFGAKRKQKGSFSRFKKWELRCSYYKRSTGLYAFLVSTHLGFVF